MRYFLILLFFSLHLSAFYEEPWGKDADILYSAKKQEKIVESGSPVNKILQFFIRFHQDVISPVDGDRSNYYPSSSEYTLQAFRRYGLFKGFIMGCDRLMRENSDPWHYKSIVLRDGRILKWDPPER